MNAWRKLFEQFKFYHSHGRPIVQYTGMVGIAAYPLFYLLRFTKVELPYNDLWLRALATLICVGLALRNYWPERLKPYYIAYSYGALLYCLPFFFIFTSLINGGGVVAVANTLMGVFFLILLTDWRNTVVMLLLGGATATALFFYVMPGAALPMDYVARLPTLVLVMIGGSLFKFAEKKAEAEKVKTTYAALAGSIAHEMRNPLGQIDHNLARMQEALPPPTTLAQPQTLDVREVDALYRHLAESRMAVTRGLQVIAMTLDEVGSRPMDPSGFSHLSAADVTRKAVQEYGYDDEADRSRVSVEVLEDFSFRGDETAYLFVLFNLMKNALYYLPLREDGRVTLTVERQQVKVRDNGPGIPPDALPRLFEPFRSVGKSGGTGLGLAYCQRIMRAFCGGITCQSVPGEYTQFTLRFPAVSAQEAETHRLTVLARAQEAFSGKRLLVVDDDAALRMTTRHKLLPLNARVDEAADGQRALEMLARERYDLVVLDLQMPVMDGYAVAERIRDGRVPANSDVCIVAYTSEPAHLASVKTQKAGMDGFVSKPCAQLALMQALVHAKEHPARRTRPEDAMLVGRQVILADDNPYNRKVIAAYLHQAGAKVTEAAHGQAVLDLLRSRSGWDAILMDVNMPGMSGLEAARAIRSSSMPWRDIPILALTAHSDTAMVMAAGAAGMNVFLTKPVDAAVVYDKLRQLIGPRGGAVLPAGAVHSSQAGVRPGAELLDESRLESYRRIGIFDELLSDYFREAERLVENLDKATQKQDLEGALEALHSLLGMSGEAGAAALHQLVRRIYVPMVEERRWPAADGWLQQIEALAALTDQALAAYGQEQARTTSV